MIIWEIPKKKASVEMAAEGWWVYIKHNSWQFGNLAECLCFLAGKGMIEYEHIPLLIQKTRERFQ